MSDWRDMFHDYPKGAAMNESDYLQHIGEQDKLELRRCPFCGKEPTHKNVGWGCEGHTLFGNPCEWNSRPLEDELNARIKEQDEQIVVFIKTTDELVARIKELEEQHKILVDFIKRMEKEDEE